MSTTNYFADVFDGDLLIPARYVSGGYPCISLKATEGVDFVNHKYHDWVVECHRHGLPVIHYHFCRPEHGTPVSEARHFYDTIAPHFRRPGDYAFWDLETANPDVGARWVLQADAEFRRLSRAGDTGEIRAGCYTYLSYFTTGHVTIPSKRMWIAAYGKTRPGNRLWKLPFGMDLFAWQYTDGRGFGPGPQRFAGIIGSNSGGTCDGSVLNPSIARQLRSQTKPR